MPMNNSADILKRDLTACKALIEASSDCIKFFKDGRCIYANKASVREHYGKLKTASDWLETIIPEHRPAVKNAIKKAHKGVQSQLLIQHIQGKTRSKWCSCSFVPVKYNGIFGINAISRDVTEMIEKEQSLEVYKTVIQNSPIPLTLTEKDGTIFYVNPAFEQLTGWKFKECIGKTPRILKSGKQSKSYYKHFWKTILKTKKATTWEIINKKKKGELYNCTSQIIPILDAKGKILFYSQFQQDITRQKKAAENVLVLSRFPEENPSPVWRVDRKGKVLYANLPAQAFLQLPTGLLLGIMISIKTGKPKKVEATIGKKTYQFTIAYFKGRDYANIYGTDITEIKQAQETLRKSKVLVEKQVKQRTEELDKKIKELELFRNSVISAELDLKRLEEENMRLAERLAKVENNGGKGK